LLKLDYVAAIEVMDNGRPGQWFGAYVAANPGGDDPWSLHEPQNAHQFVIEFDFELFIRDLELELTRQTRAVDVEDQLRAVVVQVITPTGPNPTVSMQELRELADTARVEIVDEIIQRRTRLDPRTCLGKGKLEELTLRAMQLDATLAIFDLNLTPTQVRSIGAATDINVIDRTQLILDIFAQRARTREGKLQVELAQLKYRLPRLTRNQGSALSRLGGGIGGRGPGEQKLEIDRRRVKDRISLLEKELKRVAKSRGVRRQRRDVNQVPVVSIVGYTNAGKSTLLNTLTNSEVLSEDKLFATLDPTSRRLRFPQEREVVITDTVGFIRDLPPDLVRAFQATLEELEDADLLLHVVDGSSPQAEDHLRTVDRIISDLKLDGRPTLRVFNKLDRFEDRDDGHRFAAGLGGVAVSAVEPESLRPLLFKIESLLWKTSGGTLDLPSIPSGRADSSGLDERQAFWANRYEAENTPWDLGAPHPALLEHLGDLGEIGTVYVPGCGLGHDALVLAGLGWQVTGVDLAHQLGPRLSEPLRRSGGDFLVADALRHPFPDGFDLWFDHTFLCALPESERLEWAKQAKRIIKPGGKLAAIVFPIEPLTDDPPPYPISTDMIAELLGEDFVLEFQDDATRPVGRDVPVHFALFARRLTD
ncbi:MAG: GTP-binding protein HflX, partial [Myxococcota bacterium]